MAAKTIYAKTIYATIIYTRHKLTDVQLAEIKRRSGGSDAVIDMSEQAAQTLESSWDAARVVAEMLRRAGAANEIGVFGVIPPVLRAALVRAHADAGRTPFEPAVRIITYEAHNRRRTVEGAAPTFEHDCWLYTGSYNCLVTQEEVAEHRMPRTVKL